MAARTCARSGDLHAHRHHVPGRTRAATPSASRIAALKDAIAGEEQGKPEKPPVRLVESGTPRPEITHKVRRHRDEPASSGSALPLSQGAQVCQGTNSSRRKISYAVSWRGMAAATAEVLESVLRAVAWTLRSPSERLHALGGQALLLPSRLSHRPGRSTDTAPCIWGACGDADAKTVRMPPRGIPYAKRIHDRLPVPLGAGGRRIAGRAQRISRPARSRS